MRFVIIENEKRLQGRLAQQERNASTFRLPQGTGFSKNAQCLVADTDSQNWLSHPNVLFSAGGWLDQGGGFEQSFDAGEENSQAIGLGNDGGDAERGGEVLAENVAEHGVHNDRGNGHPASDERGGLDAVHVGHGEIQDDEIGLESPSFFDCLDTVDGLAANFKTRLVLQENANSISNGDFVFDDEDAFGHEIGRT
jgi:hypothetical protein